MEIDFSNNNDCKQTEVFEYGVMFKYNVISTAKNIQYRVVDSFTNIILND